MRPNIKTSKLARFIAVGVVNTALDFGLLFVLKALGLPVVVANIISTGVAFVFSFFANKKFAFKSTATNIKREVVLFVAVTLFGLWVLQTGVIHITEPLFTGWLHNKDSGLFAAKLLATVVSTVWNYVLYNRVVFKTQH